MRFEVVKKNKPSVAEKPFKALPVGTWFTIDGYGSSYFYKLTSGSVLQFEKSYGDLYYEPWEDDPNMLVKELPSVKVIIEVSQ